MIWAPARSGVKIEKLSDLDENFRIYVTFGVGSESEVGFSGVFFFQKPVKNRKTGNLETVEVLLWNYTPEGSLKSFESEIRFTENFWKKPVKYRKTGNFDRVKLFIYDAKSSQSCSKDSKHWPSLKIQFDKI